MWLPSRKEAKRERAWALQKRTCPVGPSRMTGSGNDSASARMAATAGVDCEFVWSVAGSAWSASCRGRSKAEATKLRKPIRAKVLDRPPITTSETMMTPTATISQSAAERRAAISRNGRSSACPIRPRRPGATKRGSARSLNVFYPLAMNRLKRLVRRFTWPSIITFLRRFDAVDVCAMTKRAHRPRVRCLDKLYIYDGAVRFAAPRAAVLARNLAKEAKYRASAGEALGGKIVEIALPAHVLVLSELGQISPDIEPVIVAVVEYDAHRVVSDRLEPRDADRFLARDRDALRRAVALHLGARRQHAQELGRQRKALAVVEGHGQDAPLLVEPKLRRPWLGHRCPSAQPRSIAPSTTCLSLVPSAVSTIFILSLPLPPKPSSRTTSSMACWEVTPTSFRYLRIDMLKRCSSMLGLLWPSVPCYDKAEAPILLY